MLGSLASRRRYRSRHSRAVWFLAVACGAMSAPSVASAQDAQVALRPMTFADVMAIKRVGDVAISPDGQLVAYTVSAWEHPNAKPAPDSTRPDTSLGDKHDMRSHIWLVPASGGAPRQMTSSERGESQPSWSPDGRVLAFVSARGAASSGDDAPRAQVWLLPLDGGEATQLTSARDGVTSFSWSRDGRSIAYLTTDSLSRAREAMRKRHDDAEVFEGDFRLSHVWTIDVASKRASEVAHGGFTVHGAPSWSPDGAIAFSASPTPLIRDYRTDVYIVPAGSRALEKITAASDASTNPVWSPDGHTLAFTAVPNGNRPHADSIADRSLGNDHIMLYDVARSTSPTLMILAQTSPRRN